MDSQKDTYTVEEVAKLIGSSRETVRRMAKSGRFGSLIEIGNGVQRKHFRIHRQNLEKFFLYEGHDLQVLQHIQTRIEG